LEDKGFGWRIRASVGTHILERDEVVADEGFG
jgi:hypothetical protein